jgi:hypothetical protein
MAVKCPECNYTKYWKIRRGRLKCAACRHEWTPHKLPLRLTNIEWRQILKYFLLGLSGNKIASETGLDKKRILRALNITREVMQKDMPEIFRNMAAMPEGNHIEGFEGFWGYFKRGLASKGGIRKERFPLYLAEYVWRFEHHNYPVSEQIKLLLTLLRNYHKSSHLSIGVDRVDK